MSWKWIREIKNETTGVFKFAILPNSMIPASTTDLQVYGSIRGSNYEGQGNSEFYNAKAVIESISIDRERPVESPPTNYSAFVYGKAGGTGVNIYRTFSRSGGSWNTRTGARKYISFTSSVICYEEDGGWSPSQLPGVKYNYITWGLEMNEETQEIYLVQLNIYLRFQNGEGTVSYYDSALIYARVYNTGGNGNLWTILHDSIPGGEGGGNPYEGGGYSDVTEETGEFDEESEIVVEPQTPVSLAISSGFLTVYNPSYTQVVELGNYLWTSLDLNSLKKLFGNPMDCIIGVSIYPFQIPNETDDYYMMVGNVNTLVKAKKALGQFVTIECGKMYIKPYSMSYLDYSPFTKIELVLPYIGSYQLDTDIIMGKWIKLTYKVDLLSGACLASLSYSDSENGDYSVISEYTGKCNVDIPLVATDFRNMQGALLGAVSSFKDYISSNGASGFSPLQSGVANTVAMMKPNVNRSGALQSCIGYLGVQKPRIIKTIPRQCVAENQGYMEGFPSFIKANVGELTGFTVFEDVEIKCDAMTEKERKRAIALLEKGVWL